MTAIPTSVSLNHNPQLAAAICKQNVYYYKLPYDNKSGEDNHSVIKKEKKREGVGARNEFRVIIQVANQRTNTNTTMGRRRGARDERKLKQDEENGTKKGESAEDELTDDEQVGVKRVSLAVEKGVYARMQWPPLPPVPPSASMGVAEVGSGSGALEIAEKRVAKRSICLSKATFTGMPNTEQEEVKSPSNPPLREKKTIGPTSLPTKFLSQFLFART
ncbi:hypothetical protein F5148DRAFT_1146314 [Russula earlei]|uniref:Uncharacterized protein n=1 Tax=Russula earlei TaxID=71964 RepID=A0ACC0UKE5_9AGAM|nr:hypothetical protein F5148DRAFT_1146314 [Russula earlei]